MINMKSLLTENPEFIKIGNKKIASMFDGDVITFGYYKSSLKIKATVLTGYPEIHDELYRRVSRNKLRFPGRLWYEKKIISFWKKYPSRAELQSLIDDIKKWNGGLEIPIEELNSLNINSLNWRIEIPVDYEVFYGMPNDKSKLISLKEYDNNELQFKDVEHVKLPSAKLQNNTKGFGSDKTYAGLTATQYHQLKSTSESKE